MSNEFSGHSISESVLERLKELEEQKKQLSDRISRMKLDLRQMKQKRLDAQTMRDSLTHFSQILEAATPEEQKALVPRIVESITFTPTEIEIALFDQMIERGLIIPPTVNHSSNDALEMSRWLPGPTSQRTISVARYKLPIYLTYNGRGIGIIVGIAPIEPDETGVVPSSNFRTKNRHNRWENLLKLAFHYRELMEQGKTKAEIARTPDVSRARVTQVMNLLNLHPDIQEYLNNAKYKPDTKLITERGLCQIATIQDSNEQLRAFGKLIR